MVPIKPEASMRRKEICSDLSTRQFEEPDLLEKPEKLGSSCMTQEQNTPKEIMNVKITVYNYVGLLF
jgi:hypothetical protein